MRKDVTALLEKLGRQEFNYRQFVDPISDLEPWPLFAALLQDERVVGRPQRTTEPRPAASGNAFLAAYGDAAAQQPQDEGVRGSLHSFLSELSGNPGKAG